MVGSKIGLWLKFPLLVPNVWRRLLVALVVAESHRHLVHIHRSVQLLQTGLVVFVVVLSWLSFPVRISTIREGVLSLNLLTWSYIVREKSALVQVGPLVNALLGG